MTTGWTSTDWNGAAEDLHRRTLLALAEGPPILLDLADLHQPMPVADMPVCRGCDRDRGQMSGDPMWPCRTYTKLVQSALHVHDVEAIFSELRRSRPSFHIKF